MKSPKLLSVIADENIPLLVELLHGIADVTLTSGRQLQRQELHRHDALLVRSVTPVNQTLLDNTSIKFVATATSGIDHLDIAYLNQQKIGWHASFGANRLAVAEYVLALIALLRQRKQWGNKPRAAVIGVGKIGHLVANYLQQLGFSVLLNDPPRAKEEPLFSSTPLSALRDLDLITLHLPLTYDGSCPTYHLIAKEFLQQQKNGCVLFNTSRGDVINGSDLKRYGSHLDWYFDVFPNEPDLDIEVLNRCHIATPHIAGYTREAKLRASELMVKSLCDHFAISLNTPDNYPEKPITFEALKDPAWETKLLAVYNPQTDHDQFNYLIKQDQQPIAKIFDQLRKNYPLRHEYNYRHIPIQGHK